MQCRDLWPATSPGFTLFEASLQSSERQIVTWHKAGLFKDEPEALNEAFTCACFNGNSEVIEYLLSRGVHPSGGAMTGLDGFHWAANRGQLKAVDILVRHQASLETRNAYGGTVLGALSGRPFTSPNLSTQRSLRLCSARVLMCAKRNTRQASIRLTGY